ncbi:MAG: hypothetical protein J6I68_07370 [Butyrivibrio sp.]|uniref:MBG domain-containing protein n=1 Tax=Butyrivibrio sp. TaxID=28121 RepID=UPI001B43E6DB|nr:MBG domain-containing protein [Butyrivibrio sp.]MBP3783050.1 hypothetical protein [Butyrivibrio sp.]
MKKINRLLAVLMAFTVVITTFGSDLTTAHVYATETEITDDADGDIKTADWEPTGDDVIISSETSTEASTEDVSKEGNTDLSDENPDESKDNPDTKTGTDDKLDENVDSAVVGADVQNSEIIVDGTEAVITDGSKDEDSDEESLEAIVGNIKVTASADEGVLPEHARLDVKIVEFEPDKQQEVNEKIEEVLNDDVEDKEAKVQDTINFDINIFADSLITDKNPTGKFEPEEGTTVKIEFSNITEAVDADSNDDSGLAVFYVDDELSVDKEAKDDTASDEIAFDASHFSIYAVTMYYYILGIPGSVSFNAGVYDLEGNEITTDDSAKTVNMDYELINWQKLPSEVAPLIDGYSFDNAKINDKQIIKFVYGVFTGLRAQVDGGYVDVDTDAAEAVKFYYSEDGYGQNGLTPVAVYATDGTSSPNLSDHNADLLSTLKLGWIQDDGYFPIGVVWLDKKAVRAGLNGDIKSVIDSITDIDTSYLQNAGEKNASNAVFSNKELIKLDTDGYAKSYKTAFFAWHNESQGETNPEHEETEGENKGNTNIKVPDDFVNFKYHLDVRFATKIIDIKGVYYTGETYEKTVDDFARQAILDGSPFSLNAANKLATDNNDDQNYKLEGVYSDGSLTTKFNGLDAVGADTTLYAKFVKSDTERLGFYLLLKDAAKPGPGGQNPIFYYPYKDDPSWPGTAKSMELLTPTYSTNDGNYRSIYNWGGINKAEINYSYNTGVKESIDAYVKKVYGSDFSEKDVVWYVYKKQSRTSNYNHIDGYVSTNITYYANNGTGRSITVSTIGDPATPIRWGESIDVKSSTFWNGNKVFVGWNTQADGKGTWYGTNDDNKTIALNGKIKLYAQWAKEVEYTVNYIVQGEDGSYNHRAAGIYVPNYYKRVNYKLQLRDGEEVPVSVKESAEFSSTRDLQYRFNEEKTQTTFSEKFKSSGVGYTVSKGNDAETWEGKATQNGQKINLFVFFKRDDLNVKLEVYSKDQSWYYDGLYHSYNKKEEKNFGFDNSGNKNLVVTGVELSGKVKDVTGPNDSNNNKISKIYVTDKSNEAKYTYYVNKQGQVVNSKGIVVKDISVTFGTLTILPRTVYLTSSTISKEFDGKALTAYNSEQANAKTITVSKYVDQYKTETSSQEKHEGFVWGEGINLWSVRFTGSRTEVGGKDLAENKFTFELLPHTQAKNYNIIPVYGDIKITDRSDEHKYIIYVKLGADNTGGKTSLPYNGLLQEADFGVNIYAKKEKLPVNTMLSSWFNLGALVVHAEEGSETSEEIAGTKLLPVEDNIDGMNVVIDNLYISGGEGIDVDYYPVMLNKEHMTIKTNIGGKEIDLKNQVKIVVINDAPDATETEKTIPSGENEFEIGGLEITAIPMVIKAENKNKAYNAPDPSYTVAVSGLVARDEANQGRIAELFNSNQTLFTREQGEAAGGKYEITVNIPEVIPGVDAALKAVLDNYVLTPEKGILTIGTPSSDDIVVIDDDDDRDDETTETFTVAAFSAPTNAAAVLGAQREPVVGDGPAVLGARRAPTDDTDILGRIITIIVAAVIAFSMVFIKRKKKEEN